MDKYCLDKTVAPLAFADSQFILESLSVAPLVLIAPQFEREKKNELRQAGKLAENSRLPDGKNNTDQMCSRPRDW